MDERLVATAAGLVIGWVCGWLAAWGTDWLQQPDELPSAARGVLIKDAWVQAISAVIWAITPWLAAGPWWRWAITGVLAVPLVQVAVTDLRHRSVYTVVVAIGVILGVVLSWLLQSAAVWVGAAGAVGGGLSFGLIYLFGRLLSRFMFRGAEAMGPGDVYIAALVGADTATCAARALVLGILLGGVVALGVVLARRRKYLHFAYGPGLCLGGLVTLYWC